MRAILHFKFVFFTCGLLLITSMAVFTLRRLHFTDDYTTTNIANGGLRREYLEEDVWWRDFICLKHRHKLLVPFQIPVLYKDITPSYHKYNIFLVESSCVHRPAYRSICSVESYARQNPTADVWYVMISPSVDNADGLLTALLKQYPNLHVVSADLDLLFRGLPTYKLFTSRLWMKTRWLEIHLSDMMRLTLLGKTGGLYSDTDTVCMRDVTSLTNFVVHGPKGKFINNAIFHFHRKNPVLKKNLLRQNEVFDGEERGSNGMMVMTKVIKEHCNDTAFEKKRHPAASVDRCPNLSMMPNKAFYPIPMERCGDLFMENLGTALMEEISSSYVVHTWSGISALSPIRIGSQSLYDILALTFCPMTRSTANSTKVPFRYYGEALPGRAWHDGIGRV